MKLYLNILCFLFSLLISCNTKEKIKYPPASSNETTIKSFDNGKIKSRINYLNKKKYGIAEYYYQNGQIEQKINFVNNIKDGPALFYYKNGCLQSEGFYKNDLPYGKFKHYDQLGNLEEVEIYEIVKSKSYLNEYLKFNKDKSIIKDKSNFISIISNKDSICFSDTLRLRIKLEGSFFNDKMRILVGQFDENYNLLTEYIDTLEAIGNEVNYKKRFTDYGQQFIRGIVQDYTISKFKDSTVMQKRNIFFSKEIFVDSICN